LKNLNFFILTNFSVFLISCKETSPLGELVNFLPREINSFNQFLLTLLMINLVFIPISFFLKRILDNLGFLIALVILLITISINNEYSIGIIIALFIFSAFTQILLNYFYTTIVLFAACLSFLAGKFYSKKQ
jgi:hypothetical protein